MKMKEFGPRGRHVPLAPSPSDPPLANDFVPNGIIVLLSPNVCQCAHHTLQLPFILSPFNCVVIQVQLSKVLKSVLSDLKLKFMYQLQKNVNK